MTITLSERYLLYLREMSKKVVFGSGAIGDYSQVLITTARKKSQNKFQRITALRLSQVITSGTEGYRRELDQEKIGNGIFCGVGILAGTYTKRVGSKSTLRLIAAPTIYGQVVFEESGEAEVIEWVVNYDIATALIGRNADEEEEAYAAFDSKASKTGGQIIQDIEDALETLTTNDVESIKMLSEKYLKGFKELTETACDLVDTPLECVKAAIDARDNLNAKKFFFCPGDWIFFAPVPPGLSTYRALDDLAKEVSGPIGSCPSALVGPIPGRREARSSMSLSQDSVIHTSGPGPVDALLMGLEGGVAMRTLERLLDSVFSGKKFESEHSPVKEKQIFKVLARLPYSLSMSQRTAIYRALRNDISYIQGPPGTGKSFTISALAIAASELGLKVLVASQKTPAVDIVYEKITDILGNAACLYISEDRQRKQITRGIIDHLLNKATDYQTTNEQSELKRLSEHVDMLVSERLDYAKRIHEYESELRRYYEVNQTVQDSREVLKEDFDLPEITVKKINLLQSKDSRNKIKVLLNECRSIREESRKSGGAVTLKKSTRLKILSNAVLRALDFEIEYYKKYQEEVLYKVLIYSSSLADAQALQRVIKGQPLDVLRKTFERRNSELYPGDPKESVLAKYLVSHHSVRINRVLQSKEYRDTLDAFHRRLRWKNAKRARSANAKINFNLLFEMFPIVMGEIKSLHPYLPFREESIDLLILDEASQVNLAEIFPILFRAKRFCIVGDHNQLGIKAAGVIFISKVFEKLTWQKQFAGLAGYPLDFKTAQERDLLVSQSSILDLIRNDLNPVTAAPVLLNEHFRSLPMLAEFTSEQFYKDDNPESGLRIMTAVPDKKALNAFMDIEVTNSREENSQINKGEVEKAFEVIISFAKQIPTDLTKEVFEMPQLKEKPISVGVVCFIRDQVNYMKEEVLRRLTDEQQEQISLLIGTPEEFQGNERDVIIFTPSIDEEQKRSKAFMEDRNRFNVATSRAKYFMYFIHGKLPSNMLLMQQMLTKMGQGKSDVKEMDKGTLPIGWSYKKSQCDSEFELLVADVLEELIASEYPGRIALYNQVQTCGFRLDFVVYDKISKRAVGIEVDGKYHYLDDGSSYTDEHLERANALKRAGWVIKYLPYWNWFQDGWIDRDAEAANELRQFIRAFLSN